MSRRRALALIAFVILGAAVVVLFRNIQLSGRKHHSRNSLDHAPAAVHSSGSTQPSAPRSQSVRAAKEEIAATFALLEKANNAEESRDILAKLGNALAGMSADEVANASRHFLDENRDTGTRLGFAVGDEGNLNSAPTFRTWLLDQLGRLNPEAAADYATTILGSHGSADEWAVALRNYARLRTESADEAYLQEKARELINDPRWQREQSVGWLEAFDVIVEMRATTLTSDLTGLVRKTEPGAKATAHAAFLTLDRLVIADPLPVLTQLQGQPDLMAGRGGTRAQHFARADVRDPAQRAVLESYLLDSARSPEEMQTFCGVYPNANFMISKN